MIFSSLSYVIFLVVAVALMACLRSLRLKKALLLAGSYYFYAYWDKRFVALLFLMSAVNYAIGQKISPSDEPAVRKRWITASVVFNLGVLGFFKYFNFFIDIANFLLRGLHLSLPALHIILPVGISFITFEVMSYTIDIYRNTGRPARSFWDLALLVAFFPHLIAGPILKPNHFLPQIERDIVVRWSKVEYGIQLFLLGLVKKVLVADRLAPFADGVFQAPQNYSALTLWLAVVAFGLQIFCDFSGYSDMAIGSAHCLGFDIPPNFHLPYLSCNITEFWRRWHISLSSWLRDYLYISLGGNRKGKRRQYTNLMIVMLLGGLWHGASWNFVIWGGLHGLGLMVHKRYREVVGQRTLPCEPLWRILSWLVTMVFVCVTWVFFHSPHFSTTLLMLGKMFGLSEIRGTVWVQSSLLIALPFVAAAHYLGSRYGNRFRLRLDTFAGLFVVFFVLLALFYLAPLASSPFIYFQF